MISETLIKALNCRCNECSHSWQVVGTVEPSECPECNSTEWNTVYQKEQEKDNHQQLSPQLKADYERKYLIECSIKAAQPRIKHFSMLDKK